MIRFPVGGRLFGIGGLVLIEPGGIMAAASRQKRLTKTLRGEHMRNRLLKAATSLAALVPTLALAQQRPAQQPPRPAQQPAQRPAQQPQQRPAMSMSGTAQRAGAIELTIQPTVFIERDEALFSYLYNRVSTPADAPARFPFGVTARFGYHINEKLAVGANLGFGVTSGLTLIQPSLGGTYTLRPGNQMSPFVTGMVGASMFSGDGPAEKATGLGVQVGAGVRRFMNENVAVRLEARAGMESYSDESITAIVGSLAGGVSYYMGGGPPRDTDADGVPDRRDRCANTPRGATVNAQGCPSDADRDGVYDGLDRCANTPSGARVDAQGCPLDTDRDGIADHQDQCANTPANTPVDDRGCPRDSDRDGVHDGADRCANTPAGTPVDANGCPRDSDGDGVNDAADRCPNTPASTPVDANGCPRDADGDGVHDGNDRCPNTAAGTQVDANGCPVQRDDDRDGVINERDRCANTPAGRRVDANGCPMAELPAVGATMRLDGISFRGATTTILPTSNTTIQELARAIQAEVAATPSARFEIGGHTDNVGTAARNRLLSRNRAVAVMRALTAAGAPASALTAQGYGPDRPEVPNTSAANRARNRRIEIRRLQ